MAAAAKHRESIDEVTSREDVKVYNVFEGHESEPCSVREVDYSTMHDVNSSDMCSETNTKFWEVESSGLEQINDVQGQLKKHLKYWEYVLHAPPPILDCIRNGYRLPLKFVPCSRFQHNRSSAVSHIQFVNEEIENLVKNRCAVLVNDRPYICSPLSVVSNSSGKLRLVLNLKYLNQFLHVLSFTLEQLL